MEELKPGHYDKLITESLRAQIGALPETLRAVESGIGTADSIEYLSREIAKRLRKTLFRGLSEQISDLEFLEIANRFLSAIEPSNESELKVLSAICDKIANEPTKPLLALSQSALITNDQGINYHSMLRSELLSADRVDLICPFIGNQGLNLIFDLLRKFGDKLRVITTTYLGGTNQQALVRLANVGAQVKIVYERSEQKTGLHAKAWIFHRDSGSTTGTIGSSNLSPKALVDGLEWNVRLGDTDATQVLKELTVTFDRLWEDPLYELFDPERDSERLGRALKAQQSTPDGTTFFADIQPLPHQKEALDELRLARLDGKNQNLVVAATGTGKTLLAAFDYERLAKEYRGSPTFLFVAHREDILRQSRDAFRAVMRDGDFGELNVGSEKAGEWRQVFASVQSLSSKNLSDFDPARFDVIVMDEFHHAEAPTYLRILDHFRPRQLIGLTATPERTDGKNVIDRFGSPTYELRLWHALDRKLLCPFHYFGVDDQTDLSELNWTGGKYVDSDLERQYVDRGDARAAVIIRELKEKVADLDEMRTVAFCATIAHAEFMAKRFGDAGLDAKALHSGMSHDDRKALVKKFRVGEQPIICTVDLFNEGIDIPEINTVLFLRPTESATVFIQQLGRGLRNHHDKGALTVLDFVGLQRKEFRMDLRFRAMIGLSRSELDKAVKSEFPMLPPGCHIRLDRTTQERVLANLKSAIPSSNRALIDELRRMAATDTPITLTNFLRETGLELGDFYQGDRSFAFLCHSAGIRAEEPGVAKRVGSFSHVDDRERLNAYQRLISEDSGAIGDFARMLAFPLTRSMSFESMDSVVREELTGLFDALNTSVSRRARIADDLPFALHAHYSRDEIVGPFRDNPESMRQGTFYSKELGLDIHLFTLRKSDRDFSPTTRYQDWFIGPDLLHWESQSQTTVESATGQRLVNGSGRHLFFVRESRSDGNRVSPFMCLGFGSPISSEGECPIQLVWKLDHPVPDHEWPRLRSAAG
jgi:superfamily II DNA or RNA helicase/HKD family nuclease